MKENGFTGGFYGLAFVGALFYYLSHATTFWMGLVGIFKAIFWPAFIMYQVLTLLKM